MGLLANNPYAVANPIAEALNGLRSGFKEGYSGALDRQKAEQLAAQQAELLNFQRQEAQRKQEQAALEAKARDQFAALRASQQGAARQGLMGGLTPEMPNLMALAQPAADQYGYADFGPQMIPSERQTRAVDSVVANVLPSQKDLLGFAMQYGGTQAGDNAMKAAQVLPTGNELRDKLLATGKYTPESVDAFVSGTGKLSFAKDPSVVTWSEPYAAQVGGKKVMLQRSSTGQIKPVVEDKSTTTVVRVGDGQDKAKMYEQRAAYGELPKLRQDAQAASVVLPRLERMKQILATGNAGDTVAYLRQYLAPYAPEAKSANEAQLFQILSRTIAGPQRINIIGPGAQTEREGETLLRVGGGGNQGRAALKELLDIHTTANRATIEAYNGMVDAAGTKIYKPMLVAPSAPASQGGGNTSIPQGAINQLKSNPKLAVYFDQKYGKGASKQILGR